VKHQNLPTKENLKAEIQEAVNAVIERGDFVMGKEMYDFETASQEYLGAKHTFGLNSGTDAVRFALMALNIGPGDEVITSPFCFISNAEAIALEGAKPVFADIDPVTYNIRAEAIEAAVTPRTKAVLPIHMYGYPADMTAINKISRKHGLAVIEDACQAYGSELDGMKVGGESMFAAFSFFHTKPLGAYGDAGMLTTNDDSFAEKISLLRNHGSRKRYFHDEIGCSSRLDTIQAAVLLTQLHHFEHKIETVRTNAAILEHELSGIGDIITPFVAENCRHIYNLYTLRTKDREGLREHLQVKGIRCSVAFPLSIHLQKSFKYLGHRLGDFPESEKAQDEVLCLTIDPYWTDEHIMNVVSEIKDFFG
jgi:dTDP-4-amino-4,6-dideoxygalactose transaminase